MVSTKQKSITAIHTKKIKESTHKIKDIHQITREENKRRKEKKDLQNQIQNNEQNGKRNIHIDNYLICKWTKYSNQETQTGLMDTKIRPVYLLSTRDSLWT